MKLISCYIENYGRIKAKEYVFASGVNTFCEENGAGKSTLASFIKAMFYGLDSYRKDSKDFCDRLHFYPFEGGAFGGNLIFEQNGKTYKIERFFGEKSDTADTLVVYCDGVKTEALGEEIGKTVFGIDKTSFERTLFIGAEEIEISSTTAINAKLNNVLQGATEDTNLDSALKRIETTAKEYKKAKAGKDKISEETTRLALLQAKIENAEKTRAVLYGKMDELETYDREIATKEQTVMEAQKSNELLGRWEHYETLVESVRKKQTRLEALQAQYPFGLPAETESLTVQALLTKEGKLLAQGRAKLFSEEDEARLNGLSARFRSGTPDGALLDAIGESVEKLPAMQREARILEQSQPTEEEKRLTHVFGSYLPTTETLSATETRVAEYRRLEREYHALPATVVVENGMRGDKNRSALPYLLVAVFSVLAFLVGLVFPSLPKTLGILLTVVGGVALFADAFVYLNKKSEQAQVRTLESENPEKRKVAEEMRGIENAVRAVLLPYGYNSENGLAFDFEMLKKDAQTYVAYVERERARQEAYAQKYAQLQRIEESLSAFFAKYGASGETVWKRWNALLADIDAYEELCKRKQAGKNVALALEEEMAKNRIGIDAYCKKYRIAEADVQTAIEDARECVKLLEEITEGTERARAYKTEKGLVEKPLQIRVDTDALHEDLTLLRAKRSRLALEIEADETVAEKLGEYEADKAETEERLADYKRKHRLLTATAVLLGEAEQNLKDKYVKPIKDEFVYYAKLLEKALGEKVSLSRNFEVSFERNGKERSEKHLSAGQRSICALCFRLALIRNMYKGQTPFLVLDDPFTALDAGHMERVKTLVKALANDMQIVYFVCHESRRI